MNKNITEIVFEYECEKMLKKLRSRVSATCRNLLKILKLLFKNVLYQIFKSLDTYLNNPTIFEFSFILITIIFLWKKISPSFLINYSNYIYLFHLSWNNLAKIVLNNRGFLAVTFYWLLLILIFKHIISNIFNFDR